MEIFLLNNAKSVLWKGVIIVQAKLNVYNVLKTINLMQITLIV
jgi:hypothetical protein